MIRRPVALATLLLLTVSSFVAAAEINLSQAVVVTRSGELPAAEKMAPTVLVEELQRRTGIRLPVTSEWPKQATVVIAISTIKTPPAWVDRLVPVDAPPERAESFAVHVSPATDARPAIVSVTGSDSRGRLVWCWKIAEKSELGRRSRFHLVRFSSQ